MRPAKGEKVLDKLGEPPGSILKEIKPQYALAGYPGYWWQTFRDWYVKNLQMKHILKLTILVEVEIQIFHISRKRLQKLLARSPRTIPFLWILTEHWSIRTKQLTLVYTWTSKVLPWSLWNTKPSTRRFEKYVEKLDTPHIALVLI